MMSSNSPQPLQFILDMLPDAIVLLDSHGTIQGQNKTACAWFGEAIEKQYFSVLHSHMALSEHDIRALEEGMQAILAGERNRFEREYLVMSSPVSSFDQCSSFRCWVEICMVPSSLEDGVLVQHRDTSERKTTELAMLRRESQFRSLINGISDYAIIRLDPSGIITNWNPGAEQSYGYQEHEVIGHPLSLFLSRPEQQQRVVEQWLETTIARGRYELSHPQFTKQGRSFYAHMVLTPLYDNPHDNPHDGPHDGPTGELTGIACVVRDVTNQRAREEQMRNKADHAEMLIEISQALDEGSLDYHTVLETVAQRLSLLLGNACIIRILSDDGKWLNVAAVYHPNPEMISTMQSILGAVPQRSDEGLSGIIIQQMRPILIEQLDNYNHLDNIKSELLAYLQQLEVTSILMAPLCTQGRVIGVVNMLRCSSLTPYTLTDQVFLQDVCDRAALVLANARLFAEAQREITERKQAEHALAKEASINAAMADLSKALLSSATLEDISWMVLHAGQKLTGSMFGLVGYIDSQTGHLIVPTLTREIWNICQVENKEFVFREFTGMWGWVLRHREPMLINHPHHDARSTGVPEGHIPVERFLSAPAMFGDTLLGLVAFVNPQEEYTERDLMLIQRLAYIYALTVQRRRSEEALHKSERLVQTVVSNAPIILLATDTQGVITLLEGKEQQIINHTLQLGMNLFEWYEMTYPDRLEDIQRALAGEHITSLLPIGEHTLELRFTPFYNDGNEITGMIGIAADITERMKAEAAQQEAVKAAEAAMQAKSEFLANMSHEIRTPLNAIIGMTNLLLDTELTAEQFDFVETSRTSSNALLSIINDILDFSKIEAGRLELEQHPFDLRQCIEESLDLISPTAVEKDLNLLYLIDDHTPTMLVGDVTRLRQILVNLLSNAVKFTNEGEVVVTASLCRDLSQIEEYPAPRWLPQDNVVMYHVAVRDTGIGISAEKMSRLFQSFSQADASMTRKYGGTGLGLAISKRLAELMGGTMWAESEEGVGSTFHFAFWAQVETQDICTFLSSVHPFLSEKRALIVGDNPTHRCVIGRYMKTWGMIADEVSSISEVLEHLQKHSFDVGVIDMYSEGVDGVTLASQIRIQPFTKQMPLIIWVPKGASGEGRHTDELGCAVFLIKPIKPSQLYHALISLFTPKRSFFGEYNQYEDVDQRSAKRPEQPEQPEQLNHSNHSNRLHEKVKQRPLQIDPAMAQHHPLRILLAEDNMVNQKVALRLLEKMGYRADVAANGKEVLTAIQQRFYHVIFMDVQMPEMDGMEATRRIRSIWPSIRQPHIIAMTAHAMEGDKERCLESGMNDYISKPIQVKDMIAALLRVPQHIPS